MGSVDDCEQGAGVGREEDAKEMETTTTKIVVRLLKTN